MKLFKQARFITRQRFAIVAASIAIAAVLIGVAALANVSSLLGSLSVNLAAGALTIGVTVAIVDYLLAKEKNVQSREGREMASLEAKSVQMLIGTAINNLFRRHTSNHGQLQDSGEDAYIEYLYSYLDHADFIDDDFRFRLKDIAFFENEISQAMNSIEKINVMYGYALTPKNRTNIHRLYTCLKAVNSILLARKYAAKATKSANAIENKELENGFSDILKLVTQELYAVSKSRFKIDTNS